MLLLSCWRWAVKELTPHSPSADLDVELLLADVLGLTRAQLYSQKPDRMLLPAQQKMLKSLLWRRKAGEPVAYLLGRQEFWSISLEVTPAVLIPRPETELLVQHLLETITPDRHKIADLGTGSAAISVALAIARPDWQLVATDYSRAALRVAERNVRYYKLKNIELRWGNGCQALLAGEKFAAIISNPPYLASDDPHLQSEPALAYEPKKALIAGKKGLNDLETIIKQSREYLCEGAYVFLEHGYQQADLVQQFFLKYGYHSTKKYKDLAGHQRVSRGKWH